MEKTVNNPSSVDVATNIPGKKLSLLELNNIKLDVRHTILTPDYLENMAKENQASQGDNNLR